MKSVPGRKIASCFTDRLKIPLYNPDMDTGIPGRSLGTNFLLWGLFLLLSACFAAAEQKSIPAGVEIRIRAQPETAAIGDPVRLDLEITTPRGYTVEIMEPARQTGDFFILEFHPGPEISEPEESGRQEKSSEGKDVSSQRHRARIVAAVYKTGTLSFPAIPVYITDAQGIKTETESPSVDIKIQSILTGNEPDLRDLKKQEDIPGEIPWLLWILLAATVGILGVSARYIRRKYRGKIPSMPPVPAQDPLDLAESELRDLAALNLPENGRTKKHYVLLSEIVKRILEAAYGIATAERTTIEIMDSFLGLSDIGREIPESIHSLLLQCDVVKFAKYTPSKRENDLASEEAFRILARAREYSQQSAVGSLQSAVGSDKVGAEMDETENKL